MIHWSDFDHRTTKVLCDRCQNDITPNFLAYLEKPHKQSLWYMLKQRTLQIGHTKWVLMRFKVDNMSNNIELAFFNRKGA